MNANTNDSGSTPPERRSRTAQCTASRSLAASVIAALASVALGACTKPAPAPAAVKEADFNLPIPLNEVMAHAMDPAAFLFWSGWGYSTTVEGTFDLAPKNDAEWKRVEDGAVTVAMMTTVIKRNPYARPPIAEWNAAADNVAAIAVRGQAAAERRDKDAIGVIGTELNEACEVCHRRFIPDYPK